MVGGGGGGGAHTEGGGGGAGGAGTQTGNSTGYFTKCSTICSITIGAGGQGGGNYAWCQR